MKKEFPSLFDLMPTPSLLLKSDTPDFTIVKSNQAYRKVTKTSDEDLIGRPIFQAFPENPADPDGTGLINVKASLNKVIVEKKPHKMNIQKYDIPVRDSDEFEEKYWAPENIPVMNNEGEVEYILHTAIDVTENVLRKKAQQGKIRAEKAYEENRNRLKMILESIEDGFYVVDDDWSVIYWNKEAEKMFGKSSEEIMGEKLWDMLPAGKKDDFFENYQKVMGDRVPVTFETYYETLQEWFLVSVYPCANGISVILKDIGERKKEEKERENLIKELTRNNEDLRQFSYIISHNLREPVTNLLSLLMLLERHPLEDGQVKEILNDFKITTGELNSTIDDLTNTLVIRDRKPTRQEYEDVKFEEAFNHVIRQNSQLIKKYNPKIEVDFKNSPSVKFNRDYLENIFINLITNSLKFRSKSKKCHIKVSTIDEEDCILLTFQDNGIGMDVEKHQEKLFDFYKKFHDNTSGKGLGLFLVKSQIEAFDGKISVYSKKNKGMTTHIRFKKIENYESSLY